jgi:hypothetical protein
MENPCQNGRQAEIKVLRFPNQLQEDEIEKKEMGGKSRTNRSKWKRCFHLKGKIDGFNS